MAVMTSSARPDWQTPDCVLERVRRVGPIRLDPCTVASNPTGAQYVFWESGLDCKWVEATEAFGGTRGLIYCNPPYGRGIGAWVDKCREAAAAGETVIALLPARTDTRWFPWDADAICFWKGRLTFRGAPAPAPFPSAVVYWGTEANMLRFGRAFYDAGKIVYP